MSTVVTTNLKHPSSASNNIVLDSSGNMTVAGSLTAGTLVGGGFSNLQVFTSSGSWTVPAGITKAKVTVIGGGGGGGGTNGSNLIGGGGGGGGGAIEVVTGLTPGASITVTVGAGGTAANDTAGGTGGTSSFGAFCSATGGAGGARRLNGESSGGVGVPSFNTGAAAGSGSGGDINLSGSVGFSIVQGGSVQACPGPLVQVIRLTSGSGGDAPFGLGFGGTWQTGVANGTAGTGYGSGGSGGRDGTRAGAAGQGGVVIVEW